MELTDFIKKYSDVELKFHHYYKYSFTYKGVASDGTAITGVFGGSGDDIYRYEVSSDDVEVVGSDLDANWTSIHASKNNEDIFEWYEWS